MIETKHTTVVPAEVPDISTEEVSNYLKQSKPATTSVPLELDPAVAKELAGATEEAPEQISTPVSPTFEPTTQSMAKEREDIWTLDGQGLEEYPVTDVDKEAYLRAVLHELPVILDIEIPMGSHKFVCRIKSISGYESHLLFHMLRQDDEKKEIAGTAHFMTRMQEYSLTLQLMQVNGIECEGPVLAATDGSLDEDGQRVRALAKSKARMEGPRWAAIVTAIRIFEHKVKKCNDHIANRDFWSLAG